MPYNHSCLAVTDTRVISACVFECVNIKCISLVILHFSILVYVVCYECGIVCWCQLNK